MPKSSIAIFADGPLQSQYRDFGIERESLSIFTAAEATGIMESLGANVVLIDSGTNVRKGLGLLKTIKARHPQIPVIFLTDLSSEELAISAFRAGARDYFAKPVNRQVLKKTILNLVKIRKKSAEKRLPFQSVPDAGLELLPDVEARDVPYRLREAILHIEERLTERITLSSLAEQARMSKYHFARYFRKCTGISPMKYVNLIRIDRARVLLARDDLTSTEIAHQVGYDDLGAFIRNFKKITGSTPGEIRKRPGGDHCGVMPDTLSKPRRKQYFNNE